jgi:phage/plasmid-associated DNA primase
MDFADLSQKVAQAALDGVDLTEDGLALAFTKAHQDKLRYDHSIGRWFHWTGKAWRRDETKLVLFGRAPSVGRSLNISR